MSQIINEYENSTKTNVVGYSHNIKGSIVEDESKGRGKKLECVEGDRMVVSPMETIVILRKIFDVIGEL